MEFFRRDISWLGFNYRVLQEAQKPSLPLYERIQFLSIFSSNLDEFFRVRYPVYLSIEKVASEAESQADWLVAQQIVGIVNEQLPVFGDTLLKGILPELHKKGIRLYYNQELPEELHPAMAHLFYDKILAYLQPCYLSPGDKANFMINNALYFLLRIQSGEEQQFALLNIPNEQVGRFVSLSDNAGHTAILFVDDIIRFYLNAVFPGMKVLECVAIKLTRSADVDIQDEWSDTFEEQVWSMIKKREKALPARLLYEKGMSDVLKEFIRNCLGLKKRNFIEGGRYHNLKDLSELPNPLGAELRYPAQKPQSPHWLAGSASIFSIVRHADRIVHVPYHSYDSVLRFFNEAAIDPLVTDIKTTMYRVAADSLITNALISAAKNGKSVTAFVELKARFDEQNNLQWAKRMKAAGVKVIYSIPGMKVHAKIALVKRKEGLQAKYYGLLSTGNFNEKTAQFYTDHILHTAASEITREMDLLFAYLGGRKPPAAYPFLQFKHLWIAGFNFVDQLTVLVEREIDHARSGHPAHIIIKLNNIEEQQIIRLLYRASNHGVRVDLIVRGICCLVPGIKGQSEHIQVRRIVGRYLEHSRVFIFHNKGEEDVYIGSADLMNRNMHRRIEVAFPLYDTHIKQEILSITRLQLEDDLQTTVLDSEGLMKAFPEKDAHIDAQQEIYRYVNKP